MPPPDLTARLVRQVQAGVKKAREELLAHTCRRLKELAHHMLQGFPVVRRYEQTGDVLQNALLRLARALEAVDLQSVTHFYNLASLQLRRELLDLARRYSGPEGEAANHETDNHHPENGILARQHARPGEQAYLSRWRELHEEVEKLPVEERTIINLLVYHGFTQAEAARQLGVDERTIRRRLVDARCLLGKAFERNGRYSNDG